MNNYLVKNILNCGLEIFFFSPKFLSNQTPFHETKQLCQYSFTSNLNLVNKPYDFSSYKNEKLEAMLTAMVLISREIMIQPVK